jgi:hypothetical protein
MGRPSLERDRRRDVEDIFLQVLRPYACYSGGPLDRALFKGNEEAAFGSKLYSHDRRINSRLEVVPKVIDVSFTRQ